MPHGNEYHATLPFDLYDLTLFDLVAEHQAFTAAASAVGLTQSALTRRIASMESKLGVSLFERTTRKVRLTAAGHELRAHATPLLAQTREIMRTFAESQGLRTPELRIGISSSIGVSYLPGFFTAFQKAWPQVLLNIQQDASSTILQRVSAGVLHAGIIAVPKSHPRDLEIPHRFNDEFVLITPRQFLPTAPEPIPLAEAQTLLREARWLMVDSTGTTGIQLRRWLADRDWKIIPAMELNSFDLIVNLVALGAGVAFVPHRVLPIYRNRRVVTPIRLTERFSRTLGIVVRKTRNLTPHLQGFLDRVLF